MSLWLGNPDVDASNEQLMKVVRKAPLSRLLAFAPLLYQLSSRLASHGNNFQKTLEAFVTTTRKSRTSQDHLTADSSRERVTSRRRQGERQRSLKMWRVVSESVARKLLDGLLRSEQGAVANSLDLLAQCYVDLAMADTKKIQQASVQPIPFSVFKANCALDTVAKKLQRSEAPPVITALGSSTSSD